MRGASEELRLRAAVVAQPETDKAGMATGGGFVASAARALAGAEGAGLYHFRTRFIFSVGRGVPPRRGVATAGGDASPYLGQRSCLKSKNASELA
jgi:hypothetical protein